MAYGALPANWDTLNESQKNSAAISAGYTGLNDYNDQVNRGKSSPTGNAPASGGFGNSFNASPSIDLPALYKTMYDNSGITKTQQQIDEISKLAMEKEAAKNAAIAGTNDNPFYSEATRVGRAAKIEQSANADIQTLQNQAVPLANKITMAKQDIETQLNLQKSQYDINSQESQLALQKYSSLLSSGSLDNASGADIATIAAATGISTSMIQSAIQANKNKNNPSELRYYDDGTNQGVAVIDSQGNILKKEVIAPSKPSAAEDKAALGGGGGTTKQTAEQEKQANTANLTTDVKNKVTLKSLISHYSGVLSIDEIYRIYNTYSPWGKAKETLAEVKQGMFKY